MPLVLQNEGPPGAEGCLCYLADSAGAGQRRLPVGEVGGLLTLSDAAGAGSLMLLVLANYDTPLVQRGASLMLPENEAGPLVHG